MIRRVPVVTLSRPWSPVLYRRPCLGLYRSLERLSASDVDIDDGCLLQSIVVCVQVWLHSMCFRFSVTEFLSVWTVYCCILWAPNFYVTLAQMTTCYAIISGTNLHCSHLAAQSASGASTCTTSLLYLDYNYNNCSSSPQAWMPCQMASSYVLANLHTLLIYCVSKNDQL